MTFDARWGDFDATRVPDPPWTHVWALTARVLVTGGDLNEVENYLWRWRWSGWILALNEDANTCQVCGARMEGAADPSVRSVGRPRLNCTNVCRQQRNRLRAKALPTPWRSGLPRLLSSVPSSTPSPSRPPVAWCSTGSCTPAR